MKRLILLPLLMLGLILITIEYIDRKVWGR